MQPVRNSRRRTLLVAAALVAGGIAVGITVDRVAFAQQPAPPSIKRTVLQRVDDPGSAKYEAVMAIAEIAPGGTSGRHTHPGVELAYVLDGTLMLQHGNEAPKAYKTGDVMQNVAVIHNATNPGKKPVKILAIYIVEKGKPMAEPAK
jgi:quercetin dioxygenase-like cupin family protein